MVFSLGIHSILPRAGATMDISFDEQTKSELLLLKGNIEGLLKMNRNLWVHNKNTFSTDLEKSQEMLTTIQCND